MIVYRPSPFPMGPIIVIVCIIGSIIMEVRKSR